LDTKERPNGMNEEKLQDTFPEDPALAEAGVKAADTRVESPEEGEEAPEEGALEEELRAEAVKYKDQLLRTLAEMENLRRRTQKEREDAARYAAAPLVKDLLAVADNLNRAISSASAEARAADPALEAMVAGVEMTERGLFSVFEKHKIEPIDPVGQPFDPNWHEALFEIPDTESPNGTVLQVVEVGYRLHDRLLRPAKVGVSRGGPKQAVEEPSVETAANGANSGETN
jgi:molecular chaperone GrpE